MTGLYYYGARYYDPRVSIWLSTDPLQEKYPNISSYAYTFQNPVKFIDSDGKDVFVIIWTTSHGRVGHAGVAISNYQKTTVDGKEVMVPDGTFTYYDNWPQEGVNLGGIKGALATVQGYRSHDVGEDGILIPNISEFTDDNLTKLHPYDPSSDTGIPNEHIMQEGVLQLHTDYDTDQKVHEKARDLNVKKPKYQGKSFNCSTYVSEVLHKTVFKKKLGKENILTFLIKSVTPNKLWKDVMKKVDNGDASGKILVDPGSNVDNSFRGGLKGKEK